MKKIYWRPQGIPLAALVLLCALSVAGLIAVERFQKRVKLQHYHEKIEAARLAFKAMEFLKNERLKQGLKIDPVADPGQSGLIGPTMTETTSGVGDLEAKQTSVNPNFAAVIVDLLKKTKVREGDLVAVSYTGSFPALNISVSAAIQALKLNPIVITSVGSSQWGANEPAFLWIDMEKLLYDNHIFSFRSTAASLGGKSDHGEELSQKGRDLLRKAIKRNTLVPIRSASISENVRHRISIYYRDAIPKVFINVGGGVISVGKLSDRKLLKTGQIITGLGAAENSDSVVYSFLEKGIPVIHLENIIKIASAYGLPLRPATMPPIGEGKIFFRKEYDPWLTGMVLLMVLIVLYLFSKSDLGFRIFQSAPRKQDPGPPEPML